MKFLFIILVLFLNLAYTATQTESQKIKDLKQAADNKNDVVAQRMLGIIYYKGDEAIQNYNLVFRYLNKAAKQGDADAKKLLKNIEQKLSSPITTLEKSQKEEALKQTANNEYGQAQKILGDIHYYGQNGFPKDMNKAMNYYKLSASHGNENAEKLFKRMIAFRYLKETEEYNHNAQIQKILGDMHYYGRGIFKNTDMAMHYYRLAAIQGDLGAKKRLKNIKKQTPDIIKLIACNNVFKS